MASRNLGVETGNKFLPGRRTGFDMTSDTTVLITDMAILVAIFVLGFVAKMFPRKRGNGH